MISEVISSSEARSKIMKESLISEPTISVHNQYNNDAFISNSANIFPSISQPSKDTISQYSTNEKKGIVVKMTSLLRDNSGSPSREHLRIQRQSSGNLSQHSKDGKSFSSVYDRSGAAVNTGQKQKKKIVMMKKSQTKMKVGATQTISQH